MSASPSLQLLDAVARFQRRRLAVDRLVAASVIAIVVAVAILATAAVDALFHWTPAARRGAILGAVVVAAVVTSRRIRRPRPPLDAAAVIESLHPAYAQRLLTAVSVASATSPAGNTLAARAVAVGLDAVAQFHPARLVRRRYAVVAIAGALAAIFALRAIARSDSLAAAFVQRQLALVAAGIDDRPVRLTPGDTRPDAASPVRVRALWPANHAQLTWAQPGLPPRAIPMTWIDGAWQADLPPVASNATYWIVTDRGTSDARQITPVAPLRITALRLVPAASPDSPDDLLAPYDDEIQLRPGVVRAVAQFSPANSDSPRVARFTFAGHAVEAPLDSAGVAQARLPLDSAGALVVQVDGKLLASLAVRLIPPAPGPAILIPPADARLDRRAPLHIRAQLPGDPASPPDLLAVVRTPLHTLSIPMQRACDDPAVLECTLDLAATGVLDGEPVLIWVRHAADTADPPPARRMLASDSASPRTLLHQAAALRAAAAHLADAQRHADAVVREARQPKRTATAGTTAALRIAASLESARAAGLIAIGAGSEFPAAWVQRTSDFWTQAQAWARPSAWLAADAAERFERFCEQARADCDESTRAVTAAADASAARFHLDELLALRAADAARAAPLVGPASADRATAGAAERARYRRLIEESAEKIPNVRGRGPEMLSRLRRVAAISAESRKSLAHTDTLSRQSLPDRLAAAGVVQLLRGRVADAELRLYAAAVLRGRAAPAELLAVLWQLALAPDSGDAPADSAAVVAWLAAAPVAVESDPALTLARTLVAAQRGTATADPGLRLLGALAATNHIDALLADPFLADRGEPAPARPIDPQSQRLRAARWAAMDRLAKSLAVTAALAWPPGPDGAQPPADPTRNAFLQAMERLRRDRK